jgi:hypothetical protein
MLLPDICEIFGHRIEVPVFEDSLVNGSTTCHASVMQSLGRHKDDPLEDGRDLRLREINPRESVVSPLLSITGIIDHRGWSGLNRGRCRPPRSAAPAGMAQKAGRALPSASPRARARTRGAPPLSHRRPSHKCPGQSSPVAASSAGAAPGGHVDASRH